MDIIRIIIAWFAALPTYWKISANPTKYGYARRTKGYRIMDISWSIVLMLLLLVVYLHR